MAAFSPRDRQFEEYLRDGISAAKSGQRHLARSLLNRALVLNASDARPYVWLSATTDDPKEQIEYLEHAVALDPTNVAARRGLAILTGKIDRERLIPEGQSFSPAKPGEEIEAQSRNFKCPQCGGHMAYSISNSLLTCDYCGFASGQDELPRKEFHSIADRSEQVLDFVMPTTVGHKWAEAQHRLACEHCGAVSLLPPGQKATQCSYCGSNQLVESTESRELIDPNVIGVIKVSQADATKLVREWLRRGVFAPDNLLAASKDLRLRPAYYSCWTFDGTLEATWNCEIREGSGSSQRWVPQSGVHTQFFNDVLISGVKALTARELSSIEPFNLMDVEEFKSDYLAGWPAIIYDRSLSDASLLARENVLNQLRPQIYNLIAIGREKRNVSIGGGKWSGMSFKHILLPIWIGTYHYQGKEYHLLVNGQTGKVGGFKPRDTIKLVLAGLSILFFILLIIAAYWFWRTGGLF